MPHNAVLSAVVDVVAPHDVPADRLLGPAVTDCAEHDFLLNLVAGLAAETRGFVVAGGAILAKADAGAEGIVDIVVFDNPALGPVGAEQTFLIAGGRGPAAGSLRHFETAHGQVVHAGTFRVEAGFAHIDFGQVLVGVHVVEVRPDFSGAVRPLPYLRMPLPDGLARIIDGLSDGYPVWPIAKGTRLGGDDRVHTGCLVHGRAVEIHLAEAHRPVVGPPASRRAGAWRKD